MKQTGLLRIVVIYTYLGMSGGSVIAADRPNVILIVCDDLKDYI